MFCIPRLASPPLFSRRPAKWRRRLVSTPAVMRHIWGDFIVLHDQWRVGDVVAPSIKSVAPRERVGAKNDTYKRLCISWALLTSISSADLSPSRGRRKIPIFHCEDKKWQDFKMTNDCTASSRSRTPRWIATSLPSIRRIKWSSRRRNRGRSSIGSTAA